MPEGAVGVTHVHSSSVSSNVARKTPAVILSLGAMGAARWTLSKKVPAGSTGKVDL